MASLDNARRAGLGIMAYAATELDCEAPALGAIERLQRRALRMIFVIIGAVLLTVSMGRAATGDDPTAGKPSNGPDLPSQVALRVAQLLPEGFRMKGVTLQFTPPAGATLDGVAPGVTQLQSRSFMVQLRDQGRTIVGSATVEAERSIVVAAHDIAAGEPVADNDVETRWVEAFGAAPGALSAFPKGAQWVAQSPLRAGSPLYPLSLTRPLAARPGDLVTVSVKNGPVTVRTQLEARSAAAIGDSATMVNPTSGTAVTVMMTGPKTAELVMQ
jgi:flagella basal body P-ring formation protein FlgA